MNLNENFRLARGVDYDGYYDNFGSHWSSLEEINDNVPLVHRRYTTVRLGEDEYWWRGGRSNEHLVKKMSDSESVTISESYLELRKNATHLQWRSIDDDIWYDLISLEELRGLPGISGDGAITLSQLKGLLETTGLAEVDKIDLQAGTFKNFPIATSIDWASITDKPISFTPTTHQHPMDEVSGLGEALSTKVTVPASPTEGKILKYVGGNIVWADAPAATVSWNDVQNKPLEFTPSAHTHDGLIPVGGSIGQILLKTGVNSFEYSWQDSPSGGDMNRSTYDTDLDGKVDAAVAADNVPWTGVTGKPASFVPDAHNHNELYYTEAEIDIILGGKVNTNDARLTDSRPPTAHEHDDRYYTEAEVITLLAAKANTVHNHSKTDISDFGHNHDELYYTEGEVNGLLSAKANTTHGHTKADITDFAHNHNDIYYTETEVNSLLTNKSDTTHLHDDRYYTDVEVNNLLNGKQATLVSGTNIKTVNNTSLLGAGDIPFPAGSNYRLKYDVTADVLSSATANALLDITGFSFTANAGVTYKFQANIIYTANATTTGSRFVVNGPASPTLLFVRSTSSLSTGADVITVASAYLTPAASTASSFATTAGNLAILEGVIRTSTTGTVTIQFASEVAGSGFITVKVGSTLEVW